MWPTKTGHFLLRKGNVTIHRPTNFVRLKTRANSEYLKYKKKHFDS